MFIEEIIELLNNQNLNSKCNNYIFTDFSNEDKEKVFSNLKSKSTINNLDLLIEAGELHCEDISPAKLQNILIDFNKIDYSQLFNFIIQKLNLDEKILFSSRRDVLRFNHVLKQNKKAVQLIMHNNGSLSSVQQQLINEIFWLNTYYFNSIILLNKKEELSSYQNTKGIFLDDRENYQKIRLVQNYKV